MKRNHLNNLSVRCTLYNNDIDEVVLSYTIRACMQGEQDSIVVVPSFDDVAIHVTVRGNGGFEFMITSPT